MSIKITWHCDGCDKALNMTKRTSTDWAQITVGVSGFKGFPIGDYANGENSYELCPACQRYLRTTVNPREWARPEPSKDMDAAR